MPSPARTAILNAMPLLAIGLAGDFKPHEMKKIVEAHGLPERAGNRTTVRGEQLDGGDALAAKPNHHVYDEPFADALPPPLVLHANIRDESVFAHRVKGSPNVDLPQDVANDLRARLRNNDARIPRSDGGEEVLLEFAIGIP